MGSNRVPVMEFSLLPGTVLEIDRDAMAVGEALSPLGNPSFSLTHALIILKHLYLKH